MVNGHDTAHNLFDYMRYFGNDFPIDMNLIGQLEIIRGPLSALDAVMVSILFAPNTRDSYQA
jgi:hypothetical protein